LIFFTFLAK